jgi:Uma2 family endonuclease
VPGPDVPRISGHGVKLTYDDFVLFPDDGKRHELIDGEHYVTPSPNTRHQRIVANLTGSLWSFLKENRIGEVFGAPLDVVFSDLMSSSPMCSLSARSGTRC